MKTSGQPDTRFLSDAGKYAAYLESPEGRLRLDLAFANLEEFLVIPEANGSLCALDLGCGTGAGAVFLARLGFHVTLLDSSPAMLDIAQRAAVAAAVRDQVTVKQGDASELASLFDPESFDVIVCHNLLEYVDDPGGVLCAAARMMRGSSAILSILVRNQAGEVLKAALKTGDLMEAERSLTEDSVQESLYGGKVRSFAPDALESMMQAASLTRIAQRGVRVVADYLPAQISRAAEYERIFALERKLGSRREFIPVARYTQCMARCLRPLAEGRV